MLPKIGVGPQNVWFIMENPINPWMIWGYFPYFRKHPYPRGGWFTWYWSIRRSFLGCGVVQKHLSFPSGRLGALNGGAAWCVRTVLLSNFQCLIIPSLKLTAKAPENGWLEYDPFLSGLTIFRCHVSFRECIQAYSKPPKKTRYTTRFLLHLQYRTEVR